MDKGCDLCGDWPVQLRGKCHTTAPLRAELDETGLLTLRCYVPDCNSIVAQLRLEMPPAPAPESGQIILEDGTIVPVLSERKAEFHD